MTRPWSANLAPVQHSCISCDALLTFDRIFCDECEVSSRKHPAVDALADLMRGFGLTNLSSAGPTAVESVTTSALAPKHAEVVTPPFVNRREARAHDGQTAAAGRSSATSSPGAQ